MSAEEAVSLIYQGNPVDCSEQEYRSDIRNALQSHAGQMIERGEDLRAMIALEEVRRLDGKFREAK